MEQITKYIRISKGIDAANLFGKKYFIDYQLLDCKINSFFSLMISYPMIKKKKKFKIAKIIYRQEFIESKKIV